MPAGAGDKAMPARAGDEGESGMTGSGTEAGLSEFLGQRWWALALRGLAGIGFGVITFANPVAAGVSLLILFAVYAIVDGVSGLLASFGTARRGGRWVWLAVEAVASIVIGTALLVMPALSVALLFLVVGVKAGIVGIFLLLSSVKLEGGYGRGLMAVAGVVSLVFAILLFTAPLLGAKILLWWIATWAILLGVVLLLLGFRLKSARDRVQAAVATFRAK